jgi:oxygen-independent coproporphyrinogen-3 oxidase
VTKELRQTARRHTAETVEADIQTLREAGIGEINVDLIAGLPFQTRESWRESLKWVERLGVPHVSVYMLEVDEDSRLGLEIIGQGSRYGAAHVPDEDLTAELYETAVERLQGMGIERYEISNFARRGRESRHNLKYWKLEPYVGFGADAHGFDGRVRGQNVEAAGDYVDRWRRGEPARVSEVVANAEEERFFVGLRLTEGVSPTVAEWDRFGDTIRGFISAGLLELSGETVHLTPRGVLLSNEVFQSFLESA